MPDDPFEIRRSGRQRVRVMTGWVAAATVAGTGAVVVAVAAPGSAAADGTGSTSVVPQDSGFTVPQRSDDDGLSAPAQLPRQATGGTGHASSGGS